MDFDNHDATALLEEALRRRKPQTTCERPQPSTTTAPNGLSVTPIKLGCGTEEWEWRFTVKYGVMHLDCS